MAVKSTLLTYGSVKGDIMHPLLYYVSLMWRERVHCKHSEPPLPSKGKGSSTEIVITSTSVLTRVAYTCATTEVSGRPKACRWGSGEVKVGCQGLVAEAAVVAKDLAGSQSGGDEDGQGDNELEARVEMGSCVRLFPVASRLMD